MVSLLPSNNASHPMDAATRRNRLRRAILETLERRELMAADLDAIFAPNTTDEYRATFNDQLNSRSSSLGMGSNGPSSFNAPGDRWFNPVGGASPNLGSPSTVTWSIVPDGTPNSFYNLNSNLISFMDGIYGGGTGPVANRPWFPLVKSVFDRWSQDTGLTYVYEAADDGAPYAGNPNRGVAGVRGDVRIGGNRIDGDFNTLAVNFTPSNGGNAGFDGDMVIDTADSYFRLNSNGPTGENRGLTNVLTHEAGHGIGLLHTLPVNGTKLMEPFVNTSFIGIQHDDLLGAQKLYGDDKEPNNTTAAATDLGSLSNGTRIVNTLSINAVTGDNDYFKFQIPAAGRITVSATPSGQQYTVGNEGGAAPAPVDTLRNVNLRLDLIAADGTVLASVDNGAFGAAETITNLQLPSGGQYFIRVYGPGTDPQLYDLTVTLAGIVTQTSASTGPRLLSVAPNSGEIFNFNSLNTLTTAPTELVLRFAGGSDLDPATLAGGIRVRRAGKDGAFGDAQDQIITPGFIGFGDNNSIVILRFAQTLPDDLYRVEVMGEAAPAENLTPIRSVAGQKLTPRIAGTDRDVYNFQLKLGAQVIAIVPQPTDRAANGTLTPQLDTIRVYFNNDDLNPASATDRNFYQLVYTSDSVQPNDDVRFLPQTVTYDPVADMATLKFPARIDQLAGPGTYRLRVGSSTEVNSASNVPIVPLLNPGTDPSGFFGLATSLDAQLVAGSVKINESLANTTNPLPLDFSGSDLDPGNRDVNNNQIGKVDNHVGNAGDGSAAIATRTYSFTLSAPYGNDVSGRPVFTTITSDQMQRVREVFEFYSEQLGIDFTEVEGSNADMRVVVGDMWPNGVASRPGGEAGIAGGGLAIMDGAETWDNSFGGGFFGVALHEVGHLLGLGHTYDLPPGTTMGNYSATTSEGGGTGVATEQFPGNNDVIHGQFLYRPDNKDVDLYKFNVGAGQTKSLRVETIAERLANSSNADTVVTLYKQTASGLTVLASNNDYFSSDSFLSMDVDGGTTGATYFIAVTVAGNQDFDPTVTNSGSGGVSAGRYQLVVDLVDKANVSLVDTDGTALDGDGDGIAGGDFNFWFRTAAPVGVASPGAPKTVYVDKGYTGGGSNGSPAAPFNSLPAALGALASGDVLRVVGSTGVDNSVTTSADNPAYEIGRGGPGNAILSDGLSFQVPQGVTMMIDAGAIFKVRGSRIIAGSQGTGTDASFSSIQVLGTPQLPVFFTSYDDQSLGTDTNPIITQPQAGDWAGIEIHNDVDRAQGRGDYERRGIFLNYIGSADIRYGGGQVTVATPSPAISPIYMSEARPTLLYNRITRSADAAMSADPDSFEETRFTEPRYQLPRFAGDTGYRPDYGRVGPDIRGNTLLNNSVNGLFVRVPTAPGQEITSLNVPARFDDNDIVHVFGENLLIGGTPGGAVTERTAPNVSLLQGTPTTGGSLAVGLQQYKITFVDRFGGEGLPSAAVGLTVTAGNSALTINNLPPATGDFVGRRIWRLSPGDTTYKLVAELDRSSTAYVDRGALAGVDGGLLVQTTSQRARPDARLAIDPGIIIKSLGSRIEAGVSSQLIAEGTAAEPVIFTSKLDDRYGAGGTFDTNNDAGATRTSVGDWGGLVARHLSSMSIDHALISFGGGTTAVPGGFAGFNAVEFHQAKGRVANSTIEFNASGVGGNLAAGRGGRGLNASAAIFVDASQPIIVDNVIRNNLATAVNIDADSLKSVPQQDSGRQTGAIDRRPGALGNFGPLVRGNQLASNFINGMEVRGGVITTETVWDDTDIVHVLQSEINVPNYHHVGGLRLVSRVDESLVVKLQGANAGFTAGGRALDITDRIGGTVQLQGAPGFPVVLTSLKDDTVGAGFDPDGKQQFDTNGNGSGNAPAAGDWRSIKFEALSNDRNVASMPELETDQIQDKGTNDETVAAQALGGLATGIGYGDENLRLGFTVTGAIASPADVDVYSFVGTAGTQVWIDIDRTGASLDSVVELITESGAILAQSDDSLAESTAVANNQPSTLFQNSNTALIAPNQVQVMDQDPLAVQNSWVPGTARDLGSINPRDAGMRVVLPGTAGATTTYYLRVRSSNLGSGDPQSKLQDGNFVRDGKTTGAYRMQVRLQQTDEVGGSSIHYADVRYATNGLEALATPVHSPLLGDNAVTSTPGAVGSGVINLGDLGRTDRGALSVAGQLNSLTDVAFYEFSVRRNDVQIIAPAGGSLSTASTHVSTVFDIDYADGVGGPNTNLWVYDKATLRLVYMGSDSNVLDDRAAPTQGSDQDDMTRGSAGSKDAFIGAQALPVGDYIVAVTNNSQMSSALAQFQYRNGTGGAGNATLTRLEPIESVARLAEDRFEDAPPLNPSTAVAPIPVAFQSTQAGITTENHVPFTLGDMVSYVISDNNTTSTLLRNVNVMTGTIEEDISNSTNARLRDVAMSPDGRLVGYHVPSNANGLVTDANSGAFVQLNWQGTTGAQVALGNSGLQTLTTERTGTRAAAVRQRTQNNAQVGDGIQFNGLTIWSNNATTNASQVMIGVGSRGNNRSSFNRAVIDNNAVVGEGAPNLNTTNIVYALDPNTGAAINAGGQNPRTGNAIVNDKGTNPGTAIIEMGRFLSGTPGNNYTEGTVTGLAKIDNILYAVSDQGELFRVDVGNGTSRFAADFTVDTVVEPIGAAPNDPPAATGLYYSGTRRFKVLEDPVGSPIKFQGLAAGPRNMTDADGNSLANVLFALADTGYIYAFDTDGNPMNIFPGGTNRVFNSTAGVGTGAWGLAFSPLDVNLWHITRTRAGEAGHGYPTTFDRSRSVPELAPLDRQSLYFGFENAGNNNAKQNGTWGSLASVFNNTVNLPGGAKGAVESQPIDLSNYSADDLPMLYFNYYLSTENRNARDAGDQTFMRDSFRVYATTNGANWTLLATNNSDNRSRNAPQTFIDGEDEYDHSVASNYVDAFGNPLTVQELYDVNDPGVAGQDNGGTAPDAWRQARLNLSPFAGNPNLRLRFEFATGGTFNTGDVQIGGVELSAVAGHEITDGQIIRLTSQDITPSSAATFEFDLGLVLNLPGGASIPPGSTFSTPFGTFNLSTSNGPNNLVYSVTDSPAQVASKFQVQLQARGLAGYINPVRPNELILPTGGAVVAGPYSFTGLSTSDVIKGTPGVAAGRVSIPVRADTTNYDASAIAVRDSMRTVFANTLSNGVTAAWSAYGQSLRFFKYAVTFNNSPVGVTSTTSRYGDSFGVNNSTGTLGAGVAERAQANTGAGVFIDDIIIGFAERGEQVLNAPANSNTFLPNRDYEPRGFDLEENEQGRFQLEIRTGKDYGISYPFDDPTRNPPPADYRLQSTYDTNDRAVPGIGIQVPAAALIADGTIFTLSGGATALVTFEFNVLNGPNDTRALPTTPGNIVVSLTTGMTAAQVAAAVRNAINSQSLIPVTASVMGEMTTTVGTRSNSATVLLNGPASVGRTGLGLPAGSPLTLVQYGRDLAAREDLGDQNRGRTDQGQIIVSSTSFSNSSQWGVRLDDSATPTSPRNLPTPNPSRLTIGTVLINNIFNSNGAGGITIIGDVSTAGQPVVDAPVGRIINNSFYGTRSNDSGVRATNGATPTVMNNIFANFATAISVDAASSSTVVGANVFQNNAANGVLGSFPLDLPTTAPLYVNPTAGNFYLRPLSPAIDSSLEALAERLTLSQIRNAIGLPPSPMLAPDRDIFGQRRVDDPSVSTPAGLGSNVFKDRGATDRADFAALQAVLLQPQDNDSANVDVDRTISYVRVTSGTLDYFSILLSDGEGIGPDASTVTSSSVLLTENGRLLTAGVDYVFGYNINSRTIRLTPLSGIWRNDSVYEISMINRQSKAIRVADGNTITAGDTLTVTLPDATTRTLTFRKAPSAALLDVVISNTMNAYEVSLRVAEVMNKLGISGVKAYVQGSGLLTVVGTTNIVSSRATSATVTDVAAIADLAQNTLAANRANTLTQFTIVMPDVKVDYGDTNATPTLQVANGARHAILPVDAPLLALGQFADPDADGAPSASATGDDNDASVDLQTLGSVGGVVQGPSGPATLIMPAGNAAGLDGQSITIIDPLLKTVTLEFDINSTVNIPGAIAVNVLVGDTAAQVATKFASAVNNALLAGRVAGVAAITNGASVSLGGSSSHKFFLSAPAVTRLLVGNVEMAMPNAVGPSMDGQTFAITDGAGNFMRFEINNTAVLPAVVTAGNVPVNVDLTTATPALLASAIASAINAQRASGNLVLGVATVIGNSVTVRGNDEDGISFGNLFNSKGAAVPVTISSTGSGVVDAWIDWNGDGDFLDTNEQVITSMTVQAGANLRDVLTPASARIGFTTARFRLSVTGNLLPDQLAVGGEVEDYVIEVVDGTPPVANNDSYTMNEDTVLTVNAPGVLANDTDADGSPLTVFDPDPTTPNVDPVVAPVNGQLALSTNGSFTYTPNLDFFGIDTFVYYATDPRLLSKTPATVTIDVKPVNDAPLAFDDTITILEDTTTVLPGSTFWANDQRHFRNNPNENGQTLTLVNAQIISPAGGTVSVTNDVLTYTPLLNYNNAINGPAKVLLTIRDGGTAGATGNELTSTSTLTINITSVNDRPEFTMPATQSTTEDAGPVTVPGFLTGIRPGAPTATDEGAGPALVPENQQVSFQVRALIPTLFKTLPAIDATGQLTYELNPDVNRILADVPNSIPGFPQILVEVIAVDTGSAVATNLNRSLPVTFTILPTEVNDAPEFTLPVTTTSREDVGLVTLPNFVTGIRRGPTTALDETNQTLSVAYSFDTAAFSQAPQLNLTNGTFTYQTAPHVNSFTGQSLVVTITISDSGRNDAPNVNSTVKSVTINVTPSNDAPEFTMPATTSTVEDAGDVTVNNFLTGIRPGPIAAVDESARENQTVSFLVRAINPALFTTLPTIDATGTLQYRLIDNLNVQPPFTPILVEVIAVDTGLSGPGAPPDVNRSAPVTFTILPTEINDAPEFTLPAGTTSREDVGLVSLPGFVTGIRPGPVSALDEAVQTLSVQFTFDATAFSQAPQLNLTNGTFSYATAAHVNSFTGQSLVVTVTITDSGRNDAPNVNSTVKSLTITVTPTNDAPEFTMPATTSTVEDAGDVTVNNFITAIRPGPVAAVDESARENQTVSFQVRAINPVLFTTLPTIDATGKLQYRLADHVNSQPPFPAILVEVIAVDTGLSGPGTPPDVNRSAPATFTILPTAINDAPEFTIPATLTRLEDAGVVTVPGFMTAFRPGPLAALDEATQTLTVTVAGDSASFLQMPAIDIATGNLTFQTAPDVNSATNNNLVVTVTLTDSGSGVSPNVNTTTKTFTLVITPVNDVPRFNLPSSSTSVFEDNEEVVGTTLTSIPGFATGIAAGPATAVDETTLTATRQTLSFTTVSVSNPALFEATGQPRLTPAGVLQFDTASNQNGSSVVVVRLVDSGAGTAPDVNTSADQTFTITVRPVNDAPEFTLPASITGLEDAGLRTIPGFATNLRPGPANALDEVPQTFTVTVTALDPTAFSRQPTIAADGTLVYRTAVDVNSATPGRDLRVSVTLTDNGTAGPAPDTNVSLTKIFTVITTPVNDAPLFTLPTQEVSVIEDVEQFLGTSLSRFANFATGIATGPATATDEVGQTLSFNIIDYSSPELFSVAPAISSTGELTFKTAANRNGKSVVIVRLVDSGAFDAPNDNDSDRQTFTISVTPINDAPLFDIPSGLTVDEDEGLISRNGFATNVRRGPVGTDDENGQTISFTVVAANPAAFEIQPTIEVDGTLTFKTAPNVNSLNNDLTVRVRLTDSGLASPVPNNNTSIEKTFSITVNAVNDPPIANQFSLNSTEDQQITIQSSAVLVGDIPGPTSDEASQTLTITQVERATALGGVVTPFITNGVITSMVYTPAPNAVGIDTFLYVVSDNGNPSRSGTGTISVILGAINDPPSFTKGADQIVLEDAGVISVSNWATNILAGAPSSVDEQASQIVSFVVTADNPALFEVQPTVSTAGTLSYKPAKDAVGSTGISILAVDNGSNVAPNVNRSGVSSFSITLIPVNDAPVFTAGAPVSVNEDSGAYSQPWATGIFPAAGLASTPPTATDESSQTVDFIVTIDKPALFSVQPSLTSNGVLSFTPAQNAFGVALVTVAARDRGPAGPNDQNTSVSRTLTITINSVNDAPVAVSDNLVGNENSVLVVPAPGLLVNDTDADGPGDTLKAVAATITSEQGASVTINEDGSVTYDPTRVGAFDRLTTGQSITDRFVYQVRDLAGALSTQATVTVVINGVDDAPVAVNDLFTVPVGQSQLLDVLKNDTDIDTAIDPRTIVITSLPAFGTVTVNATGVVAYSSGAGFRGIDTFAYTVKDLAGNVSNEAIVSVVVNNVPRAANDTASTVRGRPVTIDVLANDVDLDGSLNVTTVEIVEQPTPSGTVSVAADGKITYTPVSTFFGTATFSYFVKDNTGSPSNVATVQVAVGSAWMNPNLALDVNADGIISPIDALLVIDYINSARPVNLPGSGVVAPPYFDTNGDEKVTSIDALLIINYLNTRIGGGEGEGEGADENVAAIEQAAAPIIVTMITAEDMVAIAAPMIIREIEAIRSEELNSCTAWSDNELATDSLAAASDSTSAAPLDELVSGKRGSRATDDLDKFFGQY